MTWMGVSVVRSSKFGLLLSLFNVSCTVSSIRMLVNSDSMSKDIITSKN